MSEFLLGTKWALAKRSAIQGDLSARHYQRLTVVSGETAILMDASRQPETIKPFFEITEWLRSFGLSAPEIFISSEDTLLLEDFGDLKLAELTGETKASGYALCLELLLALRRAAPPKLMTPSASELASWTQIARDYPGADSDQISVFSSYLETKLEDLLVGTNSVSLRDFHADNIMWLDGKDGIQKLGLLDYQDAFLTHPVYDLVSLLTDARTDISPEFRHSMIEEYISLSGDDPTELRKAFAIFSAQRNLRILGIFAKAAQSGKPHHIAKLPRVYGYFVEALQHPVFDPVRNATLSALPFPNETLINSLR